MDYFIISPNCEFVVTFKSLKKELEIFNFRSGLILNRTNVISFNNSFKSVEFSEDGQSIILVNYEGRPIFSDCIRVIDFQSLLNGSTNFISQQRKLIW